MLHLVQTTTSQPANPIAFAMDFAHATRDFYERQNPENCDQFEQASKMLGTMDEETRRLSELYTARAICGKLSEESMEEIAMLEANLAPMTSEIA